MFNGFHFSLAKCRQRRVKHVQNDENQGPTSIGDKFSYFQKVITTALHFSHRRK